MPEKIVARPLPKTEPGIPTAPMVAEISNTEHRLQNVPLEKVIGSARWGLESNGLEITDLLNPDPKTTKLVGMKQKWGTVEVFIIYEKPDIIVRIKPTIGKKDAETAFLSIFWEKFDTEAGLHKIDVQAELDALRQGDFRTFRIEGQKSMDLLVDQARWGLESMGMKIHESLRPDVYTAAIVGYGRIEKHTTTMSVRIKGSGNLAVVQLVTTRSSPPKGSLWVPGAGKITFGPSAREIQKSDEKYYYEVKTFWEQLRLKFGESVEEEHMKTAALTQRSAEDQRALDILTEVWNRLPQRDREFGLMVANIEADPAKIEGILGPLLPHAKEFIPWPVVPVLERVLLPAGGRNVPSLVDLSYIQVEEVSAHPAILTFARLGPNPISKELQITDKFLFTYPGMDFTDEMGRHLNNEEPLLAKYLRNAYSEETMTHFNAEINMKDKDGSMYTKILDYILKEPVQIFNILVGESQQMVVLARAFISPDGRITPFPSAFLRLIDQLVENLDRYCVKPREMVSSEEGAPGQPTVQVALDRCPFCNWILTPGKTICPMCRKELPTRESEFIPRPPPPKPAEYDLGQGKVVEPPPLGMAEQPPAPSGAAAMDARIQEINYQITALQGVINDLQSAFTNGKIQFEQYQASNDQYVQQIGKLQEEKRALEKVKFETQFKL